jgi:hypothetical protein
VKSFRLLADFQPSNETNNANNAKSFRLLADFQPSNETNNAKTMGLLLINYAFLTILTS